MWHFEKELQMRFRMLVKTLVCLSTLSCGTAFQPKAEIESSCILGAQIAVDEGGPNEPNWWVEMARSGKIKMHSQPGLHEGKIIDEVSRVKDRDIDELFEKARALGLTRLSPGVYYVRHHQKECGIYLHSCESGVVIELSEANGVGSGPDAVLQFQRLWKFAQSLLPASMRYRCELFKHDPANLSLWIVKQDYLPDASP